MATPEKKGTRTRGEFLPEDHPMAQFPEIEEYGYLLDWLQDLGPCVEGSLIGWADFKAWIQISGCNPTGWEIDTLRDLSRIFVSKLHEFRDADCISPYMEAYPDDKIIAEWQKSIGRREKENTSNGRSR